MNVIKDIILKSNQFIKSIFKLGITIVIIFLAPFILPLFFKVLIHYNIFSSVDEFRNIISTFFNFYSIAYMVLVLILMMWFFHKWDHIKEYLKNHDITFSLKDKELSTKTVVQEIIENNEKKKIMKEIKTETKENDSKNIMKQAKEQLLLSFNNDNQKCEKCNKDELENENRNLKYFAAYNIINLETKNLLHFIYYEKTMRTDNFKSKIIQGYKKRNKNNIKFSKKDIDKVAKSKYETIYEGLKFLNIIEPSEDDKEIRLTTEGKEFVRKYIEQKEV